MDGQTPEHFVEVLLNAVERAARETDDARREVWRRTIRDIEIVLADEPGEVAAARDRLAPRQDAEGRRMYAYLRELMTRLDAAAVEAEAVVERARRL